MKNIYPSYYKNFRCVADKCPDTCCAGWEVVVDPPSERRYRVESAPIGDKLRDVLTVDEDGDTVFRSEGGRCPFLLGSGLCELYCELGERALCRTCERFPRFECVLGSRREAGLSLSCPEAARLIFETEEPTEFVTEETDEPAEPNSIDPTVYFILSKAQKTAIDILSDRKISVAQRVKNFLLLCADTQAEISGGSPERAEEPKNKTRSARESALKYFADLRSLERLDPEWERSLSAGEAGTFKIASEAECEYEKLLIYLVFRYFMTAAFDGKILIKAKLFAAEFIAAVRIQTGLDCAAKSERTAVLQKFSKEVEHSEINLDRLCALASRSRRYSLTNLINILELQEKAK